MSGPLRIVKGIPDDEELAALVAALAMVCARRADAVGEVGEVGDRAASWWRAALRSGPLPKGAGAWRRAIGRD